ncbi:putative transferase, protein kinase RLK-Pelle-RLCK-VIIa-2 family [Helianthus annuus]|uniref:non-specific serine/threonine protein kinase n=1 Tax=Helianthus annuus TaxID=4232 RepID=A0A251TJ13_HELAN|nr:putative transferase, protein kinase RLK-Pelle-RLCK-VIIa-2 family [Helianthus annuus]KAJ0451933.1 putative transferase, protein kinase RLK-Pelle-RLCK-VIIa-2 family [Helianthus annuus]KAJ0456657.1 putative transferase, protein kinase RLK-Pelle-RLCK-VIIa-2 family [Helianthus annuus]KAJ0473817.1 putative transferase, protein kinase RLK-Pelle-RLCK-VIIa-2 family [Helianthus annuus]KAJ0649392.1 putative transferase, protein kinase RLK-Pelle-RLCK-VIIa-2 family [Helianthus annuus]
MVSSRGCFLMFLHSLLCISSVSLPDTAYPPIENHDCSCFGTNLGRVDTSVSSTPKLEALTYVIVILILLNIIVYMLRELRETSVGEDKKPPSLSTENVCRRFLLSEMQSATNGFDQSMIIGKGGFGKVYRGVFDNGATTVAIKRLDSRSKQGAIEFWTEIKMLSRFRHSNLVSLIGYCDEFDEMMLVYEYISGGNLAERLHKVKGSSQKSHLSLVDRLKSCIGAARALDYLHTGTGVRHRIIHRDVKSSNILLDGNITAKVSDFGLSKISQMDQGCTHVSTDVKGSFGYFDPSYFLTRRLTRKSDVYSFGVVLLEVLCGRPAVDPSHGDNDLGLVGWAQQFTKQGKLNHIIDPSLLWLTPCSRVKAQIMPDCLKAFVELADKCLQTRPKDRPTMGEVVVALEAALALQERGDSLVVSSPNSYIKSGKIMTLSRMLRNMLLVKSPIRPVIGDLEPLGKKKRQNKWYLPYKFSNKEDLVTESGDRYQELKVAVSGLKIFSLDALKMATRNFSDDRVVGEGAFGKVYKGWVEQETYAPSKIGSGIPVAVKKLDTDGYQGFEEWETEVKLSGELNHPNITKLLGYCAEEMELLLVYEFLHRGSLENYILKQRFGGTLSWSRRVKIMLGTAKGIAYLHSRENQIIIRDLKTSNILLDEDFNARIADFGLATHGPINGETHLITQVMGTYGYAAPEYVATGYLNGKNDIYAFGVVLLETLTGLRVFDKTRPKNEQDLVQWARPMLPKKKKLMNIIDPSLGDDYPPEAICQYAKLVLKCTHAELKDRPSIEQVLKRLERISCIKTKLV